MKRNHFKLSQLNTMRFKSTRSVLSIEKIKTKTSLSA